MRALQRRQIEPGEDALPTGRAQAPTQRRVGEELLQRRREGARRRPAARAVRSPRRRRSPARRPRPTRRRAGRRPSPRGPTAAPPRTGSRARRRRRPRAGCGTSWRSPASSTTPSRPAARISASTAARSGPSPTIFAVNGDPCTPARARTSVTGSFGAASRPTVITRGGLPSWRACGAATASTAVGITTVSRARHVRAATPGRALALGDADRRRRERRHQPVGPAVQRGHRHPSTP